MTWFPKYRKKFLFAGISISLLVISDFFVKIIIPNLKRLLKTSGENQIEMVDLEIEGPLVEVEPELRDILQESKECNERTEHYKTYHQKPNFKEIISELMGRLQKGSDRELLKAVNNFFYKVSLL